MVGSSGGRTGDTEDGAEKAGPPRLMHNFYLYLHRVPRIRIH